MKKLLAVALLALLFSATAAVADQINFNFRFGGPDTVTATSGGLTSGPAPLTFISDSTTGVFFPITGMFAQATTGPASSFLATTSLIIAIFTAGGTNSVVVQDAMGNTIVAGDTLNNGTLLSQIPGAGSFLAGFHVTFVDPAILAMFGLGPNFLPTGSVSLTSGQSTFDGTTFTAEIGGGSVTIQTGVVPEPVGLGVLGMGLLTIAEGLRRWRAAKPPRTNSL